MEIDAAEGAQWTTSFISLLISCRGADNRASLSLVDWDAGAASHVTAAVNAASLRSYPLLLCLLVTFVRPSIRVARIARRAIHC